MELIGQQILSMDDLKVGLIGLGSMGMNHARVIQKIGGLQLSAVYDPLGDPKRVAGQAVVHSNFEAFVNEQLDYCVIASPTATHHENAMMLISKGINVLIEKPISSDTQTGQELVEAAKKFRVIGGVGHIERYNAALREAKRRIKDDELGKIFQISTSRQGPFPGRIADVGVIKDLASHDIDLTSWICDRNYLNVSAFVSHQSGRKYEDLVASSGLLEDGVIFNHVVNWLSPLKERKVTIIGEKGTFIVDTLNSALTIYTNGEFVNHQKEIAHFKGVTQGDVFMPAFEREEPLISEHKAFRDSILGLDSEIVTLEAGLRTLQVAEAMILSYESGMMVKL
jgi:predicted dehydrogenase